MAVLTQTGSRTKTMYTSFSVEEISHVGDNIDLYRTACDWIHNYLGQPHSLLGRPGNVCPFSTPSLAKDCLRVAVVRLISLRDRRTQIMNAVDHHCQVFLSVTGSAEMLRLQSTLILFPDVCPEEAVDLIDRTKEELKASFIEKGLMLGEFHSQNESPGLHNPRFTPLRSPIPMLVIRRMVETDYVFLNRPEYEVATRLHYLEAYLKRTSIPDSLSRRKIEAVVMSLKAGNDNGTALQKTGLEETSSVSKEPGWKLGICPHGGL